MPLKLRDEKDYAQFLTERKRSYLTKGRDIARRNAENLAFYIGLQWIYHDHNATSQFGLAQLLSNWNPSAGELRVTVNRTARFIQKISAQTFPRSIGAQVRPSIRDSGSDALARADVLERLLDVAIRETGLLKAARRANFRRSIAGSHLIGLKINRRKIAVRGEDGEEGEVDDRMVQAFHADTANLILDPFNDSRDLTDHEYVVYSDVLPWYEIERQYGVRLDPEQLKTIGELAHTYLNINTISGGRLYTEYRTHSKTPGALVHCISTKDYTGRHGQLGVVLEHANADGTYMQLLNEDDLESPFGGCGLPFISLQGHDKPGDAFGVSDVEMLKDDQKKLNLLMTQMFRHLIKATGVKIMADRRSLPNTPSAEAEFRRNWTNEMAGVVWWNSQTSRDRQSFPPQIIQVPPPPTFYPEMAQSFQGEMQGQIHRSEANFGQTKSHVPDLSFQRAIEEADQVGDMRVREDIEAYTNIAEVLLGTTIRLARQSQPGILGMLRRKGFTDEDLAIILEVDPQNMNAEVVLRESAVRHRPFARKDQDLRDALAAESITPVQWRFARARDLDAPILDADDSFAQELPRIVERIVKGQPYEPMLLGEYGEVFLGLLRQALIDRRAQADPEVRQRLNEAIAQQTDVMTQEALAANPELAAQQQQPEPAPEPQAAPAATTVADLLARFGQVGDPSPAPAVL